MRLLCFPQAGHYRLLEASHDTGTEDSLASLHQDLVTAVIR